MTDEITLHREPDPEYNLARFMPQDLTQLVKLAETASKSGVFGAITPQQATMICLHGAELGINPLQALREINLIQGRVFPSASLVSALIQRSGQIEKWEVEADSDHCTIRARRKGRDSEAVVTVRKEDIKQADLAKQNWKDFGEDMLVARAVRRMARRHFADLLVGIQEAEEYDRQVIDVATVERQVGVAESTDACSECGGQCYLHPNHKTGGVYLECTTCHHRQAPPDAVRDAIRGRTEDFAEVIDVPLPEPLALGAGPDGLDFVEAEEEAPFVKPTSLPDPEEIARATKAWTAEIIAELKARMNGKEMDDEHRFMLGTFGWDHKTKVSVWLASLEWESLEKLRGELVPVTGTLPFSGVNVALGTRARS